MSTSVSIREVARHAGVSVATVSNVLNRPDIVAPATRERVRASIRALGFVRNEAARRLRSGRSNMVGLVLIDVGNPVFTDFAASVEEVVAAAGYAVMLCSSSGSAEKQARYVALLQEQRAEGIIVTPVAAADRSLADIRRRGTPLVVLERAPRGSRYCAVGIDDSLGGYLAVQHLVAVGHRRIAFVGGPLSMVPMQERLTGAHRAAVEGSAELVEVSTVGFGVADGRAAATVLAATPRQWRPTAVFCGNDVLALGVLQELNSRGLRVPQDVALVGYDDIGFAAAAAVPLSSVRQPSDRIGRLAAELVIEEIGSTRHRHRQTVFAPELVVRESSAGPSAVAGGSP